jgi:hypothetical protein
VNLKTVGARRLEAAAPGDFNIARLHLRNSLERLANEPTEK